MRIRSRIVAREFKSNDRPDLHGGNPPLEVLKTTISISASHRGVTCTLSRTSSEACAGMTTSGGRNERRR